MSAVDAALEVWGVCHNKKRIVEIYWQQVQKSGGEACDLFSSQRYARFVRGKRTRPDAQYVREFLRYLQSRSQEFAALDLPRAPYGQTPLRRQVPCLIIARFVALGGFQRLLEGELYRTAASAASRLGKASELLTSADFCERPTVEELSRRIGLHATGLQPSLLSAARMFIRSQSAAAGLAAEEQRHLIDRFTLPSTAVDRSGPRSPLCEAYRGYLLGVGLATSTASRTARRVTFFERWAGETFPALLDENGHVQPALLAAQHICSYREWLQRTRSRRGVEDHLLALRAWLRWLARRGSCDWHLPLSLKKVSKRRRPDPAVLAPEEIARLRSVLLRGQVIDRALFGLMVTTGCRCIEVRQLTLSDWDLELGRMRYRGKGKERWVWVQSMQVWADIKAWLCHRPVPEVPGDERMFLTERGHGFSDDILTERFRRLNAQAGIFRREGARILRPTFATILAEEGVPHTVRMEIMGHSDPESQLYYVQNSFHAAADRVLRRHQNARQHRTH